MVGRVNIDIVTVFPEYFDALGLGLLGKAQEHGVVSIHVHNLRDWTHDVHHAVDDTPVGGGAGMVMKPQVWGECLDDLLGLGAYGDDDRAESGVSEANSDHAANEDSRTVYGMSVETSNQATANTTADADNRDAPVLILPNPSAPLFDQAHATELAAKGHLLFGCGRYEGYDARIPECYRDRGIDVREYSIGDYVLNGGEVAVAVMIEAITRLLPGFMGNPESVVEESYTGGESLLEHRQYTKPAVWREMEVPQVLLGGDHGRVDRFRRDDALTRTSDLRPDLIERLNCRDLDKRDRITLAELGWDVSGEHPKR